MSAIQLVRKRQRGILKLVNSNALSIQNKQANGAENKQQTSEILLRVPIQSLKMYGPISCQTKFEMMSLIKQFLLHKTRGPQLMRRQ